MYAFSEFAHHLCVLLLHSCPSAVLVNFVYYIGMFSFAIFLGISFRLS